MTIKFTRNLLVCDTTQQACSVAVASKGTTSATHLFEEIGTGHAEHLPHMVAKALADAGLAFKDLDALGVTTGPGTFAGVRVGLAAMRGFVVAKKMPIYTMTGLELMARTHLADNADTGLPLACVVDARRNQVYLQRFAADGEALTNPQVMPIAAAAEALALSPCMLVGTGADLVCAFLEATDGEQLHSKSAVLYPDAVHMLALIENEAVVASESPAPLYLRPPDAELPKQDQRVKRR